MTRFQKRKHLVEKNEVNHKHCWASFVSASDNARGWSFMGYLIFCAERAIENIKSTKARVERGSKIDMHLLRQQRRSLRSLIRGIQKLERGNPSAMNGLRAQIEHE